MKEKTWAQYLEEKRMKVLNAIIPVLRPFGITKLILKLIKKL